VRRRWLILALVCAIISSQAIVRPVSASSREAIALEDGTSIRRGAGTAFARIAQVKAKTSLAIVGEAKDSAGRLWFKVDITVLGLAATIGYVASWVVDVRTITELPVLPESVKVADLVSLWKPVSRACAMVDSTSMRTGPSVSFDRVSMLPSGTKVAIIGYALTDAKELWCRISVPAEETGWVRATLLSSYERPADTLVAATIGKNLKVVASNAALSAAPFDGARIELGADVQGRSVVGVSTDGKRVFVQLLLDSSPVWLEVAGDTMIGGPVAGGSVCSLTNIEVVSTGNWSEVTLSVTGEKSGLQMVRGHVPERIEISLPRLLQAGSITVSGVPTTLVASVNTLVTEAGFVSRIVIYLEDSGVSATLSAGTTAVRVRIGLQASPVPSKSVFLNGDILCTSDQTAFLEDVTFIPLALAGAAYGTPLSWDASEQQTSLVFGEHSYVLKEGDFTLKVAEGSSRWTEDMAAAPRLINGLLFVPVSTVCRVFGLRAVDGLLRIHLDPLIASVHFSGDRARPSGSIAVSSTTDLHVAQVKRDGFTVIRFQGDLVTPASASPVLADWIAMSAYPRVGGSPPMLELRLATTDSYVVDVQTPGRGTYVISTSAIHNGRLQGKKIVVDPGHGNVSSSGTFDYGARGAAGIDESAVNLAIALKLKAKLEAEGATTLLTRTGDSSSANRDVAARAQLANSSAGDVFISIHQGVTDAGSVMGGGQTYYWFTTSSSLAALIQEKMVAALGREDRGTQKADIYLASHIDTMPSILVECLFLSNPEEEQLLKQDGFQDQIARAIADAIIEYFVR
jgi:N-acetylmuramoyl-L-alanine amidase/uncharacterized protein YgiM (DUF1202 family)